jgi:hypothetical protein
VEYLNDFEERKMDKRFWIAGIAASVLFFVLGFLFHGVLMEGDYMQLKSMFRTQEEAMGNMPIMTAAHIIMGFAFAWIYAQGISGASWLTQGVRYGLATALLVSVPWYMIYYSVQPWPGMTAFKMGLFDSISLIITAIVVAFIYKPKARE